MRSVFLLGLFAAAGTAHGAVRCIDSEGQVKPVFDAALASGETLEEVRIKSGNYFFASGEIGYFGVLQGNGKTLSVSGGWSGAPGQCTQRGDDPAATLFWGLGQRPVFILSASATFDGTVAMDNLSFGGGHASVSSSTSCLQLGEQNGGNLAVRVERVRIEGCTTAPGANSPALSISASGGVIFRNSLVAGNDSATSVPATVVAKGGVGYILNNTIADNTSANVNGFVGLNTSGSADAVVTLANNLFDRNVPTGSAVRIDVRLGTNVTMSNNRYRGLSGQPLANTGASTGPAGFGADDYEPGRTSPARDAGAAFAPILQGNLDLAGRQRVQGTAVDLGAIEYPEVFADGFE